MGIRAARRRRWHTGACALALTAAAVAVAPAQAARVVAQSGFAAGAAPFALHAQQGGRAAVAPLVAGGAPALQLRLGRAGAVARARRTLRPTSAPLVVRLVARVDAARGVGLDIPVAALRDRAGRTRIVLVRRGVDGRLVLAAGGATAVGPFLRNGRAATVDLRLTRSGHGLVVRVASGGRTSRSLRLARFTVGGLQLGGRAAPRPRAPRRAARHARLSFASVLVAQPLAPVVRVVSAPPSLSRAAGARVAFATDDPDAVVACSVDGSVYRPCASPLALPVLGEGVHAVAVRATDVLGSASVPVRVRFVLDRTPPNTAVSDGPAGGTTGSTAQFTLAANEAATFRCSLDGAAFAPCASPLTLTGLAPGGHVVAAVATDAAGNVDPTPATAGFTVASPEPGIASRAPAPGADDVATGASVTVAFSVAIDPDTVTPTTLHLAADGAAVPASVSYDAATRTATLRPSAALRTGTTFTATIEGGGNGVRAADGGTFPHASSWTFATAPVLVGAGDVADCPNGHQADTAALIAPLYAAGASVFTAGDNAYPSGTSAAFDCFDASWGAFKARLHPALGNEDASTSSGAPYFAYFGAAAGPGTRGYYSYDLGAWHVIVLNSNCASAGGPVVTSCAAGSAQETWLKADLAAHPSACTLAVWHHPRWSSAFHSDNAFVGPLWTDLYAAGADLVLSGHDHDYERFQPVDPAGVVDAVDGVRQFVVGTGGAPAASSGRTQEARSARWIQGKNGVLELTLHPSSYAWRLVEVGGATDDSGSATCHAAA